MKELENYLLEYFKDWDLSSAEKEDLQTICEDASNKLTPFYNLMQKMIGLVFNEAVKKMVHSFEERAYFVYSSKNDPELQN